MTLKKLASPKAMLVRNSDPPTDRLNGVKCRAISVINKKLILLDLLSSLWDWLGLDRGQKLHVVNSKSQKMGLKRAARAGKRAKIGRERIKGKHPSGSVATTSSVSPSSR